jgi:hypothetical protein
VAPAPAIVATGRAAHSSHALIVEEVMTRLVHLLTALGLTCVFAGAIIAACGAPLAPRETPPFAPRPERVDPTALPEPTLTDPATAPLADARLDKPTPISAVFPVSLQLASATQPSQGTAPDAGASPTDAGAAAADAPRPVPPPTTPSPPPQADASADSYTPPLPPIPDGNLPADSRLEPIRLRD